MEKQRYTLKEKLDIAESVSTIIMFLMAIWGSLEAYEAGFWHKINHIVSHYHEEILKTETAEKQKKFSTREEEVSPSSDNTKEN